MVKDIVEHIDIGDSALPGLALEVHWAVTRIFHDKDVVTESQILHWRGHILTHDDLVASRTVRAVAYIPLEQRPGDRPPGLKEINVGNIAITDVVEIIATISIIVAKEPDAILPGSINLIVPDEIVIARDANTVIGRWIGTCETVNCIIASRNVEALHDHSTYGNNGKAALRKGNRLSISSRHDPDGISSRCHADRLGNSEKRAGESAAVAIIASLGDVINSSGDLPDLDIAPYP